MLQPRPTLSPEDAMRAVEARPADADRWVALAEAWVAGGRHDIAEPAWAQATQLQPRSAFAWAGRALSLRQLRRFGPAVAAARRAVGLGPDEAWLRVNLSALLLLTDAHDEALAEAERAVTLAPQAQESWGALHSAAMAAGDPERALAAIDRAAEIAPCDPRFRWNRALFLLSEGRWAEGWPGYEARLERPGARRPPAPAWSGDAAPVHLLITLEQGLGDTFQLLHLLARARDRVARLCLAAPSGLHAALAGVPGVDALVSPEQVASGGVRFEAAAALPSLPALLGLLPSEAAVGVPALAAPPAAVAAWSARLRAHRPAARLRVGLCWQGNPAYEADHRRSPGLGALAPLAAVEGVGWFSVQKVHGQLSTQPQVPFPIVDLDPELDQGAPFTDSLPCLAALDLIITSDTATAHLAGQLGRPVWLALCWAPDWRWGRHGDACPWYPSMRLFRQPRPGDWRAVYAAMAAALAEGAPLRSPPPPPAPTPGAPDEG